MAVKRNGSDDGPVQLEVTEATTSAKPKEPAFAGLAAWLSGGFLLLTGLLAAVGSYTGGVARIMRNSPGTFQLALLGVLAAVCLGVVAGEVAKSTWSKKKTKLAVQLVLLQLGIAIFLASMYGAVSAAAHSSTLEDRPSLNAQLAASELRVWSVRGTAATSGLASDERLQVLVYGVPSA